ncbi:MAG: hypothetical protein GTN62_02690 [Gemmatimonadales bacterium]|nr:hypothetical protein [Gemmatimonadales bacterium]NIN10678.1 hypothetical protein [Gemmatimonadales bacterium]NIN49006.1 hypothetical protein [Gemmatimonadales bacterium]NIP06470.1 hypothetical protein [Gemmatimonadales bacterium]NIQ98815.1 hypothetical protein [Gemmatimonadales bacterium]
MTAATRYPALHRLLTVARQLGALRERIVFIGGAIAPLLQEEAPFPAPRPTSDVDGVVATASYTEAQLVQDELVALGFRQAPATARHAHRWMGPTGIPFDLAPAGQHAGASGNPWDEIAVATAVEAMLEPGFAIRHASAAAFLALKWSAYHDRGRDDPLNSHDLEDVLALIASRPSIAREAVEAPTQLRAYLAQQAEAFLANRYAEDLLAGHLNYAQDARATMELVRERLLGIAEGGATRG